MFDRQKLKYFYSGFLSVFQLGAISQKETSNRDIAEYFCKEEQDMLLAYEELRKTYERN